MNGVKPEMEKCAALCVQKAKTTERSRTILLQLLLLFLMTCRLWIQFKFDIAFLVLFVVIVLG